MEKVNGLNSVGEPEEVYDILAGYYDEDEFDDFGGLKAWEVIEISKQRVLKEALSMCYDELGGYFSEDEDMSYRDDENYICPIGFMNSMNLAWKAIIITLFIII